VTAIWVQFWLLATLAVSAVLTEIARQLDADQLAGSERSHPDDGSSAVSRLPGRSSESAPGWLPATLPAPPAATPPRRPRVCAGRVAPIANVITVRDPAGWPVASYAAGTRWPALEGTR
jgi:hypothetical protein